MSASETTPLVDSSGHESSDSELGPTGHILNYTIIEDYPPKHEGITTSDTGDDKVYDQFTERKAKKDANLGKKTVGTASSYIYVINQIFGPGVVSIPIIYYQSGYIFTVVALIFFFLLSALATTLLVEAIARIPGNAHFDRRIEYAIAMQHYLKRWPYIFCQVMLTVCLLSLTISSITITVQAFDQLFWFIFGKSCAFEFAPQVRFYCGDITEITKWFVGGADGIWTISLGYLAAALFIIPMSMFNLDGNIIFQWISFAGLLFINLWFVIAFLYGGPDPGNVPVIGDNFQQIIAVMLTCWSYLMVIPSWVNEKKNAVSINKVIWNSSMISVLGYIFISGILAMSLGKLDSDDVLEQVEAHAFKSKTITNVTKVCAYLFSLFIIMPGTPVFQISIRYNLYVGRICSRRWSFFWSVIAPWLVSFIFLQGNTFATLLNWAALIFGSVVNFILPFVLYFKSRLQGAGRLPQSELIEWTPEDHETDTFSPLVVMQSVDPKDQTVHFALPLFLRTNYSTRVLKAILVIFIALLFAQIVFDIYAAAKGEDLLG